MRLFNAELTYARSILYREGVATAKELQDLEPKDIEELFTMLCEQQTEICAAFYGAYGRTN